MSPPRTNDRRCALALAGWLALVTVLDGQAADGAPPPLPPLPPSPIALFRELLAADTTGRTRLLSQRSEPQRTRIEAKLREYEALPAANREARLQATELRWYLRPLLAVDTAQRETCLAEVPDRYQSLLREHLAHWDGLDEATRRDLIAYESLLSGVLRLPRGASDEAAARPTSENRDLEAQIAQWRALPEKDRDRMCLQFKQFFELSPRGQELTLSELAEDERRMMEDTLNNFRHLPPMERRLCVESFRKFAGLTPQERSGFLRSADKWREMSPADRAAWRELVSRLPPFPPGFADPPAPPALPSAPGTTRPQVAGY